VKLGEDRKPMEVGQTRWCVSRDGQQVAWFDNHAEALAWGCKNLRGLAWEVTGVTRLPDDPSN